MGSVAAARRTASSFSVLLGQHEPLGPGRRHRQGILDPKAGLKPYEAQIVEGHLPSPPRQERGEPVGHQPFALEAGRHARTERHRVFAWSRQRLRQRGRALLRPGQGRRRGEADMADPGDPGPIYVVPGPGAGHGAESGARGQVRHLHQCPDPVARLRFGRPSNRTGSSRPGSSGWPLSTRAVVADQADAGLGTGQPLHARH